MDHKTVKCLAAQQLRARAKKIDPEEGTALHNIYKIGLNTEILSDINDCINSKNYLDVSTGLYYLIGLMQKYKIKDFDSKFIDHILQKIPSIIENKIKGQARYYALNLFIFFRKKYPFYREKMLELLQSNDLGFRKIALNNYETYCKPKEIEPLLIFEKDNLVTESSMRGSLSYELRNIALEKIGKILGKNFMIYEMKERDADWGNDYVSWYDWKYFWTLYSKK